MWTAKLLSHRFAVVAGGILAVLVIGALFAFEPVTRNLVAREAVCTYCHLEREYVPTARLSVSRPHPPERKEGQVSPRCVDCHLPRGLLATIYAYTHFLSVTDLFGHLRDRASERSGDWLPPSAASAYRVRDRLFAHDSVTCRGCHIESEIKPERRTGQKAHKKAFKDGKTCIECHNNLVHREVEIRETAFMKPESPDTE